MLFPIVVWTSALSSFGGYRIEVSRSVGLLVGQVGERKLGLPLVDWLTSPIASVGGAERCGMFSTTTVQVGTVWRL